MTSPASDSDYWTVSRTPFCGLMFILPFLIVYEIGVFEIGLSDTGRNAADVWIRFALRDSGVPGDWALPALVLVVLLGWHLAQRKPFRCDAQILSGMFAESLLFAAALLAGGRAWQSVIAADVSDPIAQRAVSFLGAGIYEELLFRLLMIPLLYGLLRLCWTPRLLAMALSALMSSGLFALAHYADAPTLMALLNLQDAAETVWTMPEHWYSFQFRLAAGVMFSLLFWMRGFGITVGCHLLYDLLVGVVLRGVPGSE